MCTCTPERIISDLALYTDFGKSNSFYVHATQYDIMLNCEFPSFSCAVAKDLLSKILNPHPLSRATVEEILSHPWMQPQEKQQSQEKQLSQEKQRSHLCRLPATSFLHARSNTPQESDSTTELQDNGDRTRLGKYHSGHRNSSHMEQKSHHHLAIRKNSSGSSGYASDASNLPSPISPILSQPASPVCRTNTQ